ncbi:hypothetical protein DTL42_16075 [Bremerella cremea]|uniref:Uncharacterized protein n=1 Tax=Bremerella cremea TaxID=1031537 RepID=A0A368KPJ6_9BACT|nr:hypothetical protein [Bremerella cremea]RCS46473.1 hypothetical protein DTL42_16075 [Bremerella cremea]
MVSLSRFSVPVLMAVLAVQACQAQSPPSSKPAPRGPQTEEERAWAKVVPALKQAHQKRVAAADLLLNQLRSSAADLATKSGRDAFTDAALGLKSKHLMLTDSNGHRTWLRQLYVDQVLPVDHLQQQVKVTSEALTQVLAQIDHDLVVEQMLDVEEIPLKFRPVPLDLARFQQAVDHEIDSMMPAVMESTTRQLTAFAAGAVGGTVAGSAAREAMRDEQGNVSLFGELFSLAVGFGADMAVDHAMNEALETRKHLSDELQRSTNRLLVTCLGNGAPTDVLIGEMVKSIRQQEVAMAALFIRDLDVDMDWAVAYYDHVSIEPQK